MINSGKILILVVICIFSACKKEDSSMNDTSFNVDAQKYTTELSLDYSNANQYHTALSAVGATNTGYNTMMYTRNDSAFSNHFYQFCIDMMKNGGMMSSMSGMKSGTSGSMMGGSGSMMSGVSMGGSQDMTKMMAYMDSVCLNTKNSLNPDYLKNDSLLYNQMAMCKMMTSKTTNVENVYNSMQTLRRNHKQEKF